MSKRKRGKRRPAAQRPAAQRPAAQRPAAPRDDPTNGGASGGSWYAGWRRAVIVALAAAGMVTLVCLVAFRHLWYGFHDVSDTVIYFDYATRMARGFRPYRDFSVEYPPLAVPLFRLPGHTDDLRGYMSAFSAVMEVATAAAAAVTAAAAALLWRDRWRPYLAGAAFAVAVTFTGALIANRYDAVVALDVALFLLFLAKRWYSAAAVVIGLGFALKLTPVILLPLVFLLDPRLPWIALRAAYFAVAAFLPFVPYLAHGTKGLEYVFTYHLERPLQIESVLTTPFWIGRLTDGLVLQVGSDYGSQFLIVTNPHASWWALHGLLTPDRMKNASGWLTVAALTAVYVLAWRRRETLRTSPNLVPVAVLGLILAFMAFGKVLSPQFLIWMIPAVALVVIERRVLGALCLAALFLTQLMFPFHYWDLVEFTPDQPVAGWWEFRWAFSILDRLGFESLYAAQVLVVRNLLVLAAFGCALWALWRLPAALRRDPDEPAGLL